MKRKIAICFEENVKYPSIEDMLYPDQSYSDLDLAYNSYSDNAIFGMIRDSFYLLGLDRGNFGTEKWNPLQDGLIKPGNTVLIKPNMVSDKNDSEHGTECLYTHPSMVAAVIPYVWKALAKTGRIIVADAPVQSCDFNKLISQSGYARMIEHYQKLGVQIEIKDLRGLISRYEEGVMKASIVSNDGIVVDLGEKSEHAVLSAEELKKVRITNYNPEELLLHHNVTKHEYFIAREALAADVIINMPKPKSHRKAGVTIAMKNFVGVNKRKEYLPHHRIGNIGSGGDEYQKNSLLLQVSSALLDIANRQNAKANYKWARFLRSGARLCSGVDKRLFSKEVIREGSWHGNDTIWRTIIDINKIVAYADREGIMQDSPQRKIFTIADMIIIGEKEGPLLPSPKYGGIIAMGDSIVCFDEAIASILGFDIWKLPLFRHIREVRNYPLIAAEDEAVFVSNIEKWNGKSVKEIDRQIAINIEPSSGWKGHIELD